MATLIELAKLSDAVYTKAPDMSAPAGLSGWVQIAHSPDEYEQNDHYYGAAFQNMSTGEIVIANRGTDPASLKDLWSNVRLAVKQIMPAQTDAINFAKQIAQDNPTATIIETGHSLGGNEAQAADAALETLGYHISAVTFQAPGIPDLYIKAGTTYNVLNIYNEGDLVRLAGGSHIGTSVLIPAGPSYWAEIGGAIFGWFFGGPRGSALVGGKDNKLCDAAPLVPVTIRRRYCLRTISPILASLLIQFMVAGHSMADDNAPWSLFKKDNTMTSQTSTVAVKIAELTENMEVRGLDFSPDGKYLAATSTMDSNEVHIWDWQGSRSVVKKMNKGGGAPGVISGPLRYSPDGRLLAACHSRAERNIIVHIWDAQTGSLAHFIDEPETGGCNAIDFTPDGQWFVRISGSGPQPKDSGITVYNTSTWQPIWSLGMKPFHPKALAISADGSMAALGGENYGPGIPDQPKILIVDLLKRTIVRTIDAFPEKHAIRSLAWHPNGIHIAAGTLTGTTELRGSDVIRIFDARTGNLVTVGTPRWPSYTALNVDVLRYSPDGKYLVESGATVVKEGIYRHVHIWDGQHQTLLQEIHAEPPSMAFSRDGRFLAMGGDKKILIWQMK